MLRLRRIEIGEQRMLINEKLWPLVSSSKSAQDSLAAGYWDFQYIVLPTAGFDLSYNPQFHSEPFTLADSPLDPKTAVEVVVRVDERGELFVDLAPEPFADEDSEEYEHLMILDGRRCWVDSDMRELLRNDSEVRTEIAYELGEAVARDDFEFGQPAFFIVAGMGLVARRDGDDFVLEKTTM